MKKPIRNYLKLVNEIINIQSPFDIEIVGFVNYDKIYPLISLHSHSKLAKYNVVINSGAHGEEVIAVKVLLRFISEFNKELLGYYNFIINPIINPYGFVYNLRKNGQGLLANTAFNAIEGQIPEESKIIREVLPNKIDLFIDLHADTGKTGFYVYERKRPEQNSLAEKGLKILKKHKLPIIETVTIYQEKCVDGVIVMPIKDGSWDDEMFKKGAIYSICLEIPGKVSEDQQMIGGLLLLNELLNLFKEKI